MQRENLRKFRIAYGCREIGCGYPDFTAQKRKRHQFIYKTFNNLCINRQESCDVNMKRADGKTVLDLAKECGSYRIQKILKNLDDSDSELSSDEGELTSEDESENEFSDHSVVLE